MKKPGRRKLKQLFFRHGGSISEVAKELSVSRKTIYSWIAKFPEVKAYHEQSRDYALLLAKEGLISLLEKQDKDAILFTLRTLDPAYSEKKQINKLNVHQHLVQPFNWKALSPEEQKTVIELSKKLYINDGQN